MGSLHDHCFQLLNKIIESASENILSKIFGLFLSTSLPHLEKSLLHKSTWASSQSINLLLS